MKETLVIILFFLWYALSLAVSEIMGRRSRMGTEWLFFISMVFSPLTGFVLSLFLKKKE